MTINDYPFEKNDFLHYFRTLKKDRGFKAYYQFLNRPLRRSFSRSLIKKYSPTGVGLEIGCGARTIVPTTRTVLSDAFSEHGVHGSIAKVFFKGDLIPYADETFQFVLSEHVLEHIANPIKTLKEWIRVLKKGGQLYLFLPHKERMNDKFREVTTLSHLIEDYNNNTPYDDDTHYEDYLKNVVEKNLLPDHYKHLSKEDFLKSASIHHHVFTEKEITNLLTYLNMEIKYVNKKIHDRRDTFLVVGQKK